MSLVAEKLDVLTKKILHLSCVPRRDTTLLKITVSGNEMGIIYRVTGVLFAHGWDILEAMAETSEEGYVQDIFVVRSQSGEQMTELTLKKIRKDLNSLFFESVSVIDYMESHGFSQLSGNQIPDPTAVVKIYNPISSDFSVMDIRMKDRPGVLFQITRILYFFGVDIISFTASSEEGRIRDSFLLRMESGEKLDERMIFPKLKASIESLL
jgi:[protein-PII] uridylyltransferase